MQASVPIEKALSELGDCILAYEMNGAPIPRDHGGPLRAIVPGYAGVGPARQVVVRRGRGRVATGDEL